MQKTPNRQKKKGHKVLTQIGLPRIFGLQPLQ